MTTETSSQKIKHKVKQKAQDNYILDSVVVAEPLVLTAIPVENDDGAGQSQVKIKILKEKNRAQKKELIATQKQLETTEVKLKAKSKQIKDSNMANKNLENNLAYEKAKVNEEKQKRSIVEEKYSQLTSQVSIQKEIAESRISVLNEEFAYYKGQAIADKKRAESVIKGLKNELSINKEITEKIFNDVELKEKSELEKKDKIQEGLNAKNKEIERLTQLLNSEKEKNESLNAKVKELEIKSESELNAKELLQATLKAEEEKSLKLSEELKLEKEKQTKTMKVKDKKGEESKTFVRLLLKAIESANPDVVGSEHEALTLLEKNKEFCTPRYLNRMMPSDQGKSHRYILLEAVKKKLFKIVEKLLECGANVNLQPGGNSGRGRTCLHLAVINKDLEIVKLLLNQQSIDINVKDHYGNTPLHYAVYNSDESDEFVKLIMEKRPQLDIKNNRNLTVHDNAKGCKSKSIQTLLAQQDQAKPGSSISNHSRVEFSKYVQEAMEKQAKEMKEKTSPAKVSESSSAASEISQQPFSMTQSTTAWTGMPGRAQLQFAPQGFSNTGLGQSPASMFSSFQIIPTPLCTNNNGNSHLSLDRNTGNGQKRRLEGKPSDKDQGPPTKKIRVDEEGGFNAGGEMNTIDLSAQPESKLYYFPQSKF